VNLIPRTDADPLGPGAVGLRLCRERDLIAPQLGEGDAAVFLFKALEDGVAEVKRARDRDHQAEAAHRCA